MAGFLKRDPFKVATYCTVLSRWRLLGTTFGPIERVAGHPLITSQGLAMSVFTLRFMVHISSGEFIEHVGEFISLLAFPNLT